MRRYKSILGAMALLICVTALFRGDWLTAIYWIGVLMYWIMAAER